MKLFKKLLVILAMIGVILGGVAIVDYFVDEIDIYRSIMNIFTRGESDEEYTKKNLNSFTPTKVDGFLKASEEIPIDIVYTKLVYDNDVIWIPMPTSDVRTTYSDTTYASDGSFYIAMSDGKDIFGGVDEVRSTVHTLGYGKPNVVEIRISGFKAVVYIQCYTPETLAFFTNIKKDNLVYNKSPIDLTLGDEDVASTVVIPQSVIPEQKNMFLDNKFITITQKFNEDFDGYSKFYEFEDKIVSYYRAIGFLDVRMQLEYARLLSMGYTPLEYGYYAGVDYIKFENFTVIGKSVTKNTCLIYHVTNKNI